MSHHLYHTEGLILGQKYYGEADVLYQIFSPDLGLVGALARGARQTRSKLRPHLGVLSQARLTLVRGRELWRLTAAQETGILTPVLSCPATRALWARVAGLVLRLVRGEDHQTGLYYDLVAGLIALVGRDNEAALATHEQLLVLRLLAHLGYVAPSRVNGDWLDPDLWQNRPLSVAGDEQQLLMLINHGIAHSQL